MKTLKSILERRLLSLRPKALILPVALCATAMLASAQGYYDDDLYYDASKAKKEAPKTVATKPSKAATPSQPGAASGMYYYDGAAYVPWDSVGDFQAAGVYLPSGGSTRDVDEYNRRGAYQTAAPDSISLQDFEAMSATEHLARFGDSQVAKEALASQAITPGQGEQYADIYNAGYSSGYDAGYNASPQTALSINFGPGYPYGYYSYYNTWGWPYYSWRNPYYWYNPWWGWDYYPSWSWGWGWTSPSWAWGYPGYYPGHWGGVNYRPSPSAAHRPRSTGYNYLTGNRYGHSTPGSSTRPGYRPPAAAGSTNGGYYGGTGSGRNSHFGTGSSGYRPSTGHGSGSTRQPGATNGNYNRGNFGASQSTRNGSSNSYNSNRSGSYNSNRSSGGYSGGSRSGGYSGGGRSGGGGHRSR